MLPEEGETPDVEDQNSNADDDQSTEGHDVSAADEGDDIDGERDESGGGEDDGLDDDAGADEGQEDGPHQVNGQSRGNRQFGELRGRARQAERERDELRQRLEQIEQTSRRQGPAVAAAERRAKLELMSPDEKTEFLLNEQGQRFESELRQIRFETQDGRDKIAFESLCARKPHMAKLADRVEEELVKMRRNGGTAPRETIALFLIGKDADARASKVGGQQKRRAEQNIQRQTAKPSGQRSNVQREDGGAKSDKSARAKRLDGVNI